MTRELKFKVWDKKTKQMRNLYSLNMSGSCIVQIKDSKRETLPPSRIKVLQFTGLKDKNGKPIWEGDIVKVPHELLKMYNWQVVFLRGAFVLSDDIGFRYFNSDKFSNVYEVIGNIYQHPSLV